MTEEKLEKAKSLQELIKRHRAYVNKSEEIKDRVKSSWDLDAHGRGLVIPQSLNEIILLLVENEHKKILTQLEKELEEL